MSPLEVTLFGSVRVSVNHGSEEIRLTRTIQGLFAYLMLQRNRTHPRDVLASLFWADASEEHARGCLNTALWRLRQALEPNGTPPGTYLIINPLGEVGFNPVSDFWLDVAEFEGQVNPLLGRPVERVSPADESTFEQSLDLYRGDLLDGFYEDWALRERERLRFLYLNGLAYLMRCYRQSGAYEKSLVCGQRILALDPLREEIHRTMMRLYLESGQRALALRQYEFCRKALQEELGIAPMEETQALYEQIFERAIPITSGGCTDRQTLEKLLDQLQQTQRTIDSAHEQIRQIMSAVQDIMGR